MYFKTVELAKRFGEIFFTNETIEYFEIESDPSFGRVNIKGNKTSLMFFFLRKDLFSDKCDELNIKYNSNQTLSCKLNEYSKDIYFNASLFDNIGVEHEKIEQALDEINKVESFKYYNQLLLRFKS